MGETNLSPDARLALLEQTTELRGRIYGGQLVGLALELAGQKLLAVEAQLVQADAPAPFVVRKEFAELSREEAAQRAAAIRARPEYFNAEARGEDGQPLTTPAKRAGLLQEHQELMAVAHPDQGD